MSVVFAVYGIHAYVLHPSVLREDIKVEGNLHKTNFWFESQRSWKDGS